MNLPDLDTIQRWAAAVAEVRRLEELLNGPLATHSVGNAYQGVREAIWVYGRRADGPEAEHAEMALLRAIFDYGRAKKIDGYREGYDDALDQEDIDFC